MRTLLVEARSEVGGTAASEQFAGATVNICNCDHLTFRTTPVIEELGLRDLGLAYIDLEPAQHNFSWASAADGKGWSHHADLDATLDDIGRHFPTQVDGYRRYVDAAAPAVRMIFEAAAEPPTVAGLTKARLASSVQRREHADALVAAQRCRRAEVLLRRRSDHGARRPDRTDGVGHHPRDARQRTRRPDACDASRRPRSAGRSAAAARCLPRCSPRSWRPMARCARRARSTRSCAAASA